MTPIKSDEAALLRDFDPRNYNNNNTKTTNTDANANANANANAKHVDSKIGIGAAAVQVVSAPDAEQAEHRESLFAMSARRYVVVVDGGVEPLAFGICAFLSIFDHLCIWHLAYVHLCICAFGICAFVHSAFGVCL